MESIALKEPPEAPKCQVCEESIFPTNPDSTKRFPVRYKLYNTLCQACYNAERDKYIADKPIMQQSTEVIVTKREEFFNAEKTDLALLTGTAFERIIKIRERIDKWKDLLFEIRTRQESAQGELQKLAAGITEEERNKLKISDLAYTPLSLQPKPKQVRVSKEDKALNSMMNTLFGKKIATGELTTEQAMEKTKEIVRHSKNVTITRIAEGSLKCTCQVTPGICKVHEK